MIKQPWSGSNEIVLIFGRKRTGKTRWMIGKLEQLDRVLYLDPKGGEYSFGVEVNSVEGVRELTESGKPFHIRIPKPSETWSTWICQQALKVSKPDAPVTVAADEMQRFSQTGWSLPGIELITEEGGWRSVSFYGCAHRPTDIDTDLLQAADRLIIFQTHFSLDIKRLQHYCDIPDEAFMDLKQDEYIEWSVENGRQYSIKNRDKKEGTIIDQDQV